MLNAAFPNANTHTRLSRAIDRPSIAREVNPAGAAPATAASYNSSTSSLSERADAPATLALMRWSGALNELRDRLAQVRVCGLGQNVEFHHAISDSAVRIND